MKAIAIATAFCAALLVSAPTARAQPPQAAADAPSEHKLELARELIKVTGLETMMLGAVHKMIEQTNAVAGANLSQTGQERLAIYTQAEEDAAAAMAPKLVKIMEAQYAQNFTEQELSDIVAFYRSPSGRSMVAKQPQFLQDVMGQMLGLVPGVQRDMGTEICAKVTCTAAEKSAFFGPQH